MCVLILNGETIASGLSHSAAVREARLATRLFGAVVTVFNLKTKEQVEWTK
jgi:hypothetical protein